MRRLIFLVLLTSLFWPRCYAGEAENYAALAGLEKLNGFEADPDVKVILSAYEQLPADPNPETIEQLLEERGIASWTSLLADYLSLSDLLFADRPAAEQKALRAEYSQHRKVLADLQSSITAYVRRIHPGFSVLGIAPLQQKAEGKGVRIVVFDVFDFARLEAQKKLYPKATFTAPLVFGKPVELSHGNIVIDIILQLAPAVDIIPVAADARSYTAAMEALSRHTDIDLINMSRAFADDPITHGLDQHFQKALRQWTEQGILVKALGNTGTDLEGRVTARRLEKGLGPVNNLASYDTRLIREFYAEGTTPGMEVFALNLSLFARTIALTATIPGSNQAVQERTLGVPAEGIYSPSTDTFESGSSFAAPQLTAWLALLLNEQRSLHPEASPRALRKAALQQLFENADRQDHSPEEWGRGRPRVSRSPRD